MPEFFDVLTHCVVVPNAFLGLLADELIEAIEIQAFPPEGLALQLLHLLAENILRLPNLLPYLVDLVTVQQLSNSPSTAASLVMQPCSRSSILVCTDKTAELQASLRAAMSSDKAVT
eukprot:CAMPEP_0194775318 /NCGR_PEP_ID=MMETSP0323_2-20130528/60073_1 /TAXON_ID=2866 ORGANISM="Crypthecodinium cohnii, Strain Seligo" /NCGR_SAMPLE_ID=MMETSP0323_2 /ASSEMBLY_ACC=CAM_ASM_000346 /LENGTH=116 /DNA_ID=CAMNT_0039711247 /DNA_START=477 /DNA_END=828 /DNA_ORIENTATION=+